MNMTEALSIQDYHAHPAVSKSTLDLVARDPYLVEWSKKVPQDAEKMEALNLGDALHAIILEPHRLKSDFVAMPAFDKRTKEGKANAEAFAMEHSDQRILSADEFKQLQMMLDSVLCHPQARAILDARDAINEASFFWRDELSGLQCKCRPDRLLAHEYVVDVKTTQDMRKFSYAVEDFRYHVQDAFYTDGLRANNIDRRMAFLVVGKTIELGRYPVQVFTLPDEATMYGRQLYRRDLETYAGFLNGVRKPLDFIRELPMSQRFINECMENLEIQT